MIVRLTSRSHCPFVIARSTSRHSDFSDDSSEDAERASRTKYMKQLKRYLTNEDSLLMPSTTFALAKWIWLKQADGP